MAEGEPRWCRGIRGAITVEHNTREEVLAATRDLLVRMIEANGIKAADVTCAFFTTTVDLNAEFPALAARQLGWTEQALMCGHEMNVPGSLQKCIRIMVLVNTSKKASEVQHIYLKGAVNLRSSGLTGESAFKPAP
ncbi:MAG: chorismate mutase [Chloroflexi bacterium]|nr:chorismate mutase [Chloroflexota bacterium]